MSTSGGTGSGSVTPANILSGFTTFAASGGPATVLTIPAGRIWVGTITLQCAVSEAAAGAVGGVATLTLAQAGNVGLPALGTIARCDAVSGANAAGGTTGSESTSTVQIPWTCQAGGGGPMVFNVTAVISGTAGQASCTVAGALQ